jgi:hypothetical protein
MVNNKKEYFIVNLIFVLIIGVVFGYSYFFYPNNQPIECVYKASTGKNCSTCGFSRAFSAFTHFDYGGGFNYNANAFGCFLFFLFQFLLRILAGAMYLINPSKPSRLFIIVELVVTAVFFLLVFCPLLMN